MTTSIRFDRFFVLSATCAVAMLVSLRAGATNYAINPSSACSLALAIQAASSMSSQGACAAGTGDDAITLDAGNYYLTSSVVITRTLSITGSAF